MRREALTARTIVREQLEAQNLETLPFTVRTKQGRTGLVQYATVHKWPKSEDSPRIAKTIIEGAKAAGAKVGVPIVVDLQVN